jgi:hypothetical protein
MPESVQAKTQLCLIIKIVLCEKLGNQRHEQLGVRLAGQGDALFIFRIRDCGGPVVFFVDV